MPAAYVLLRRRGAGAGTGADEVMLQLRSGTGFRDGYWAAGAAGHVEAGESALRAACREAVEELGIRIAEDDLVPLSVLHRTQGTGKEIDERVDFFFECTRWEGDPHRAEPDKSAELGWFALDALPEPVVPHELAVLTALRGGGRPPMIMTFGFPG
ncbi:MAG: 8-oxo-dGTP diphosphatase [Actinomycetota bacterium]|nr:8-oxo-dGTP diphosphatase [Actinomycetota bacterium]